MIIFDKLYVEGPRVFDPKTYFDKLKPSLAHSINVSEKFSLQPRLIVQDLFSDTDNILAPYNSFYLNYNPFKLCINAETVTIQGVITELGAPVLKRRVKVVLLTFEGDTVDKTYTDLEGNFVFYEIPQNLSLMAVAIDNTYKYNATILSKILTVDNGE